MVKTAKLKKHDVGYLPLILFFILVSWLLMPGVRAAELVPVQGFGSNPGNLAMFKYVPDDMPENAPLVVSLHGCKQSAAVYSVNGWIDLADNWKFYLLFPEQSSGNNFNRCFNWFQEEDTRRGSGEAASIESMIDKMMTDHSIDGARIYIEGLSAGGYMTAVMLAAYPDLFAGGAVNAGGPAYCALSLMDAWGCMQGSSGRSPEEWGGRVRTMGFSGYSGPWPRVSIWHGTADPTVDFTNRRESMEQWTDVHGIDRVPDMEEVVGGYPRKVYHDAAGRPLVETWAITGMTHGTPVDPGFAEAFGCGRTGDYVLDANICSVYYISRFWGLHKEQNPPLVKLTAPEAGALVSGGVSVSATASDDTGVVRVEFSVDAELRYKDDDAPYGFVWDSSREENGKRVLTAAAFDAAGNRGEDSIEVMVSGGRPDTTPPVVTPEPSGGSFKGSVTVALSSNEPATIRYTTDGSTPTKASAVYREPLTFTFTTTLSFFAEDLRNSSKVQSITYALYPHEQSVSAKSWEHLNAGRLTPGQFVTAGNIYGYMEPFPLFRFGTCWTDHESGAGRLGNCGASTCQSWTATIGEHIAEGRAYSERFFFFSRYYAVGTDTRINGTLTTELLLHEKTGEPGHFHPGGCP